MEEEINRIGIGEVDVDLIHCDLIEENKGLIKLDVQYEKEFIERYLPILKSELDYPEKIVHRFSRVTLPSNDSLYEENKNLDEGIRNILATIIKENKDESAGFIIFFKKYFFNENKALLESINKLYKKKPKETQLFIEKLSVCIYKEIDNYLNIKIGGYPKVLEYKRLLRKVIEFHYKNSSFVDWNLNNITSLDIEDNTIPLEMSKDFYLKILFMYKKLEKIENSYKQDIDKYEDKTSNKKIDYVFWTRVISYLVLDTFGKKNNKLVSDIISAIFNKEYTAEHVSDAVRKLNLKNSK
jgi:hypothetical protein